MEKNKFKLIDGLSSKGTELKYIEFFDKNFRFSNEQLEELKSICKGYFFYSKSKRMWGFTCRGNNELNVSNYIGEGTIPQLNINQEVLQNVARRSEQIPFNLEDFEINFIELPGRPLFYHENKNGIIDIVINLSHWFFEKKDETEKELARKIILSLVGTELEFTSPLIESYFVKLNSIQQNLKYSYGNNKQ